MRMGHRHTAVRKKRVGIASQKGREPKGLGRYSYLMRYQKDILRHIFGVVMTGTMHLLLGTLPVNEQGEGGWVESSC